MVHPSVSPGRRLAVFQTILLANGLTAYGFMFPVPISLGMEGGRSVPVKAFMADVLLPVRVESAAEKI